MRHALVFALVTLAAAAQAQVPRPLSAPTGPATTEIAALREIGFDQKLGDTVPLDLAWKDDQGRTVTLRDYTKRGRPVVLSLVYYGCPMLCTLSLNGLTSALNYITFDAGKEFELVTVSFDAKESPALAAEHKKSYLQRYRRPGADQAWHFLTGDQASVDALTKAVGFRYKWDEKTRQWAHAAGVVVISPEGTITHYLYGVEYQPKDLRLAVTESSAGRVGTPVEKFLLYCYKYDPMTGRYGMVAMNLLRGGAVLTLLGLGSFLTVMWRREARAGSIR